MTTPSRRDVDRVLREVFREEGRITAPTAILEGVFEHTVRARQTRRRPWDGWVGRPPGGSARVYVAAAALVIGIVWLLALSAGNLPVSPLASPSPSVASTPRPPAAIACQNGSGLAGDARTLWVACSEGLQRIDISVQPPVVGEVVPGVGLPARGGAGTWAPTTGGIAELDGAGRVLRTLPTTAVSVLAVGRTSIFVGSVDGILRELDPRTGSEVARATISARPLSILATPDSIWLGSDDGRLRRYDQAGLAELGTYTVGASPARLAATSKAMYVLSLGKDELLSRVDLATGAVTSGYVGVPSDPDSLMELVATDAGVWVSRRANLARLDDRTFATLASEAVPAYPAGIVVVGSEAWIYGGRLDLVTLP